MVMRGSVCTIHNTSTAEPYSCKDDIMYICTVAGSELESETYRGAGTGIPIG
jgi:hypothetical protein